MNTKRIFILGAGFSKMAGMPLSTEITEEMLKRFEQYDQDDMLQWFKGVEERIKRLEKSQTKINIEQVFDIGSFDAINWRMRQQLCPVGRYSGDTPYMRSEAIETWLIQMEDDLRDIIFEKQRYSKDNMDSIKNFAQRLQPGNIMVTFNYDTLLESALTELNKKWCYGFEREGCKSDDIKMLKMHGSINWIIVERENTISFNNAKLLFRKKDKNKENSDFCNSQENRKTETEYYYELACLPEESVKNYVETRILQRSDREYTFGLAGLGRHKPLDKLPGSAEVWNNATKALKNAKQIFVIGFSLSPFDIMVQQMFTEIMLRRCKLRNLPEFVKIIDPSANSLVDNYKSVFGDAIKFDTVPKYAQNVDWKDVLGEE